MSSEHCPACGAALQLETRGPLLDKIQVCRHCNFERDVLDEVTIRQQEDGREVTIHRKDLNTGEASATVLGDPTIQARLQEMTGIDMADLLQNAESIQASGKKFSRTTTTTQTFSGPEAERKMAEMGFDMHQMGRDSQVTPNAKPTPLSQKTGISIAIVLLILLAGFFIAGISAMYFLLG